VYKLPILRPNVQRIYTMMVKCNITKLTVIKSSGNLNVSKSKYGNIINNMAIVNENMSGYNKKSLLNFIDKIETVYYFKI
jgi:hypothetical protein